MAAAPTLDFNIDGHSSSYCENCCKLKTMRINRFLALATGISRRAADKAIASGQVIVNGVPATLGQVVSESDEIVFDNTALDIASIAAAPQLIMFNKPIGYVCSRDGQGSKTIYDLLPPELHSLKPIGRLDKDSSGLLLLTNDGKLAHTLTHPSFRKDKIYKVELNKSLVAADKAKIEQGVELEDGVSALVLQGAHKSWQVIMHEGRNRQIRRTFAALGYMVTALHRTHFGSYELHDLRPGDFKNIV